MHGARGPARIAHTVRMHTRAHAQAHATQIKSTRPERRARVCRPAARAPRAYGRDLRASRCAPGKDRRGVGVENRIDLHQVHAQKGPDGDVEHGFRLDTQAHAPVTRLHVRARTMRLAERAHP